MNERIALRQEERRRQVLAAAVRVFSTQGYRAASMQSIADEVGLSKPALYHYVPSKQAVLIELYAQVLRESVESAQRIAAAERPALEALEAVIVDRVAYTCENQALLRICFEEEASLPGDELARLIAVRREYEDTVLRILERAELNLPASPRIVVNTLLGAANWTYKWYDPHGSLSPSELGRAIAATLLAGLAR